jgi:hypothetical protein
VETPVHENTKTVPYGRFVWNAISFPFMAVGEPPIVRREYPSSESSRSATAPFRCSCSTLLTPGMATNLHRVMGDRQWLRTGKPDAYEEVVERASAFDRPFRGW